VNIEEIRIYCLEKKGVTEGFPFDETTLVFKVSGKMFCLTNLEGDLSVNLKNDPEKNIELRERYPAVKPGYHMNKQLWNTVQINGTIPDTLFKQLIDESYGLIVDSLSRKQKEELKQL
jgi:predicted DNA-binding protein (MmcQ/YjbR family)